MYKSDLAVKLLSLPHPTLIICIYIILCYFIPMTDLGESLQYPPDRNYEFPGLELDVARMREQLSEASAQLTLERELAVRIHAARYDVLQASSALRMVYGIKEAGEAEPAELTTDAKLTMDDVLSSAFMAPVADTRLPEDMATKVAKNLRTIIHPDNGGETEVAQRVNDSLDGVRDDASISIVNATLATVDHTTTDASELLRERYRIAIALGTAKPHFENEAAARENAEKEINGAEWRMRVNAVFEAFDLITGGTDTWNGYLQDIRQQGNMYLIKQANQFLPVILAVHERLAKGDPLAKEAVNVQAVDAVLERIWSTLSDQQKNSLLPYHPPYQHWIPILLPAMELLDPGEKPGETYTHFIPPFTITEKPKYVDPDLEELPVPRKKARSLLIDHRGREEYSHKEYYNKRYDN
jgi:hypothetical protein